MIKAMKLSVLAIASAIDLLGASTALAGGSTPKVPTYSGPYSKNDLQAKPTRITITEDGYVYLAGPRRSAKRDDPLSWTRWTATSGHGSGFEWINNCKPSCVSGTFHSYPVNLKAWRPRPLTHRLVFTRMTVTYTGKLPPHTSQKTQVWKVTAQGKNYFWVLPNH